MLIRTGFVTNSSSTNFLIISKEELTEDYLVKKLGFNPKSKVADEGYNLAANILNGIDRDLRWFDLDTINYDTVKQVFGEESAYKFRELEAKGYNAYWGHTSSDDSHLTAFMTVDHFVIDKKDFYFNGKNCYW